MCTFELRRMNAWGNLWLQLALCFALLVWMRPPGPQWLAELVKDHQRSGCGTYRFLVSVVYPVLYPSGAPERRLNPAAADSLTCLWIIWVWINTYENTIFSGLFTSILTQLFWCELQGYYWFWPIPIWVFFWVSVWRSTGTATLLVHWCSFGRCCGRLKLPVPGLCEIPQCGHRPKNQRAGRRLSAACYWLQRKGRAFHFSSFFTNQHPLFFIPLWFPYYYH